MNFLRFTVLPPKCYQTLSQLHFHKIKHNRYKQIDFVFKYEKQKQNAKEENLETIIRSLDF